MSHEYQNAEQIPLYYGGNGNPPSGYNHSSISGDSEVSSVYTCFVCGMDGHLSRFSSQMQSLADCGPSNNMLYPHCPPNLVSSYCHEQDMQPIAHHTEKWNRPCI